MIYGIIVFGLRKGSGIHRRGSGCFPKCLGTRTLYLGQRGKPTRFLESAKGSFAKSRGQTPGSLASGSRRRELWRLALESENDSCLACQTDFEEALSPRNDPRAQHINREAGLAPKTHQETQVDPRDLFLSRVWCPQPPYSSIIL